MEVFSRPPTSPVTLRRQAAMRQHSSSSGQQWAVALHGGKSAPERSRRRRSDDGRYPHVTGHGEVEGTPSALDSRAPVNLEELDGLEVTSPQVSSEEHPRESYEDLMEAFCSPAGGIAAALRSVASWNMWGQGPRAPLPQLFPSGQGQGEAEHAEAQAAGVPPPEMTPHEEGPGEQGGEEQTEGESAREASEMPQLKFIHILPLYQDYGLQCMRAELCKKRGMFEVSTLIPPCPTPEGPPLQVCSLKDNPSSLWQDLPEVRESGLLDTLTPRDKRLQEAMFEMMGSEASYLKSLVVAVSHFLGSQELRLTLSKMEHHILFSNLTEVKRVSERFLLSLESHLGENVMMSPCEVGDLVLHHRVALRGAYVPYITNMMYQETLIRRLLQENKEFVEALRKLECAPVCQRQRLKSFLILPFQRLTRLRIILENILKLIPPDLEPVISLKEAITAVHQIVTECDRGVQRMRQTEELVHLDKLVDFGSVKSIPLISRGRCLLHEGSLRQVIVEGGPGGGSMVSYRDIHLHLFNNLLLLSLREAGRFSVLDYSVFPAHVEVGQLKAAVLGLPSGSFLLRLSQNHAGASTAFILAADTRSDREIWIRALSPQSDGMNTPDHQEA
ncbi:hypothetical protein AAFF_G00385110 [Aldrovandia affinis]|uniref:Uncharacterized protein n=1 Tax=Aldrovandia affinis TaxID=143900 RepID=A0AAD7WLM7_9TELE|nr:hypothetical protein AAFF_G00385110 [Aldrovandia affinis]